MTPLEMSTERDRLAKEHIEGIEDLEVARLRMYSFQDGFDACHKIMAAELAQRDARIQKLTDALTIIGQADPDYIRRKVPYFDWKTHGEDLIYRARQALGGK